MGWGIADRYEQLCTLLPYMDCCAEFDCSSSGGMGVRRRVTKLGTLGPCPSGRGVADSLKHASTPNLIVVDQTGQV